MRTATAQPSSSVRAATTEWVGVTLGRYQLERELGAGGMGVVHAAFDPDLERRIALKVLRAGGGGDAEKRLLREARAMARLVHPNVVMVHEVGSANGRDYIAMELVEGVTLAEWLRSEQRPQQAIIDAFVGAARGLAAAHAAGIVHRDFKPHNVLRSRSGRIVVTDFGLAREADAGPVEVVSTSEPAKVSLVELHDHATKSTPLAGLTVTGSLLGTPAYMAPEQWRGQALTPATDQFAFCVALWEALAGERPFWGPTIEELRAVVERGPAALDASRIPRRLRAALRRGLDPDPARRWPSMDALIGAIARGKGRPAIWLALIGAVVVAAVALAAHAAGRSSAQKAQVPLCAPPALDPSAVWSDDVRKRLVESGRSVEAAMLQADATAWRAARDRSCAAAETGAARGDAYAVSAQTARQVCLDAVLVRFDTVAHAVGALARDVPPVDPGAYLIDPAVCEATRLPRLALTATPQLRDAIAAGMREEAVPGPQPRDAASALVERVADDPCAAALARVMMAATATTARDRERPLVEAVRDTDQCNDDRIRAEVAIGVANSALGGASVTGVVSAKVRLAEVAVERVAQRDLTAEIDRLRLALAMRADQAEEAIARGEAATAGFAARGRIAQQLAVSMSTLDVRFNRGRAADLEAAPRLYREWRALGVERLGEGHPAIRRLDGEAAAYAWSTGDVAGAHARLAALRRPVPYERSQSLRGRVVDARGAAVEGATVVTGPMVAGDSIAVGVPWPTIAGELRYATTDSSGAFEFADAPTEGVVIAQRGAARSMPIDVAAASAGVTLALEPTSRIEGRVDLRGEPVSRVLVSAQDLRLGPTTHYAILAPVAPDGTFAIDGVPRTRVRVYASRVSLSRQNLASTTIAVGAPVVRNVALAVLTSKRVVHVIVRSTVEAPVGNAHVLVLPGRRASTNALAMFNELQAGNLSNAQQLEGDVPKPVLTRARSGDVFATVSDVPEGAATACAMGLPADLTEFARRANAHYAKIEVRCVPIPQNADAVIVEVPPPPRLD